MSEADPFTVVEHEVLRLLGAAFNAFNELPNLHPADLPEFIHYTHALQNMVIQRPGARALYGVAKPADPAKRCQHDPSLPASTLITNGLCAFKCVICQEGWMVDGFAQVPPTLSPAAAVL